MTEEYEKKRLQARELLLRSRIYRFFAVIFALAGILLFLYLYLTKIEGNVMEILQEPALLAVITVPFLPAAVFSWLAARAERKFLSFFETAGRPESNHKTS